ncbi:MAG: methylmalonyl-CoA mutase [Chloroflexota bacterium]|nr:MAG: methylmalonyl-CoA mutase [Chloroflexota bacterium]
MDNTSADQLGIEGETARWLREHGLNDSQQVATDLGIEVQPIYTPADIGHINFLNDIGYPGEYPFTRGPYPEMSRMRPWRYSVFSGFDTPEETNKRWRFLHQAGQLAFSVVYDMPSHMGFDPDDPEVEDQVGRLGIPVSSTLDIETVFKDLPLGSVPFYSNMETLSPLIVAMYIAAAEKRGIPEAKLPGSISNDPLSTAISKSTTVFAVRPSLRLACDLIEYCCRNMPKFYPLNIKGINMSEGGGSIGQEVGFSFSNARVYVDESLRRGIPIDDLGSRITFFFGTTLHLFEEVAKYRAARRLWARLIKEEYRAENPAAMALKFTALACPLWMQFEQPELNLVRGAIAGLAQALGGAQATPHPGYDEVFAIPNEHSQNLALGTQQILAEETNITKSVDPLGGSYYVEWLTDRLEREFRNIMAEVEKRGGALKAIEAGYQKREILAYYTQVEREIANGKRVIVRRNKYRVAGEGDPRERLVLHESNKDAVQSYIAQVKRLKAERDNSQVEHCLNRIVDAARGTDNLMPYFIDAARVYATLGEMTRALKQVFAKFESPSIV